MKTHPSPFWACLNYFVFMGFLLLEKQGATTWNFLEEREYLSNKKLIRGYLTEENGINKPAAWHAVCQFLMPGESRDLLYSIFMTALSRGEYAFVRSCFSFHLPLVLKRHEWTLLLTHVVSLQNTVPAVSRGEQSQFLLLPHLFQKEHEDVCENLLSPPRPPEKLLWNPWAFAFRSGRFQEAKCLLVNHLHFGNEIVTIENQVYQTESVPALLEESLLQFAFLVSYARRMEYIERLKFLLITTKDIYEIIRDHLPKRQTFQLPNAPNIQALVTQIIAQAAPAPKQDPSLEELLDQKLFLDSEAPSLTITPKTTFEPLTIPFDSENESHVQLLSLLPQCPSFWDENRSTFFLCTDGERRQFWVKRVFLFPKFLLPRGRSWICEVVQRVYAKNPDVFTEAVLSFLWERLGEKRMRERLPQFTTPKV